MRKETIYRTLDEDLYAVSKASEEAIFCWWAPKERGDTTIGSGTSETDKVRMRSREKASLQDRSGSGSCVGKTKKPRA